MSKKENHKVSVRLNKIKVMVKNTEGKYDTEVGRDPGTRSRRLRDLETQKSMLYLK